MVLLNPGGGLVPRRATLSFTWNFGRPPQSPRRPTTTEPMEAAPDPSTQIP